MIAGNEKLVRTKIGNLYEKIFFSALK